MIAHPECEENLLDLADFIGSTSKLLNHAETSDANTFIVLTEPESCTRCSNGFPTKH